MSNEKFHLTMRLPDGTTKTFKNVEFINIEEDRVNIFSSKKDRTIIAQYDRKTKALFTFSRPVEIG